jgi:hypothetical protein
LPRPSAPLLTRFFWAPAAFLLLVRFIDPPFPDRHSTAHRFPVERKRGDSLSEITPLCMLRMRRLIQHRPADHRSSFASETRSPSGPETPAPHRRSRSITPASSRRHIVVAAVALSPASHRTHAPRTSPGSTSPRATPRKGVRKNRERNLSPSLLIC